MTSFNTPTTILIVDDNTGVRTFCRAILGRAYDHILQAPDCAEAARLCREHPVDLCFVDLTLPDGDGLDLIEELRELQPQLLPIIISGHQDQPLLLRALQLGVKNYLLKPFTADQLLHAAEQILAENHRLKERIRLNVLSPFFELSEGFLAEINLPSTLQQIVQMAKDQSHADVVSLMVVDEETDALTIEAAIGLPLEIVTGTTIRPGEGIAGWVTAMKEPLILIPGVSTHDALRAMMFRTELTASLCVPLIRKEKVIGVLNIGKKSARASFTQGDLELASVLCRQAAILIDNVRLFTQVTLTMTELETANFETIKALAGALESKDFYTRTHSDRTVVHADLVGHALGLSARERLHLRYAAILHDIGKIGIPEQILNKPDRLTEEEYTIMKRHPRIGAEIIGHISFLEPVLPLILHDHERWDGRGYPHGLVGTAIPLGARIIAVVDAYDAMAADRIYRKAPGHAFALRELRRCAGSQFDPTVVDAFLDVAGSLPPQVTCNSAHFK